MAVLRKQGFVSGRAPGISVPRQPQADSAPHEHLSAVGHRAQKAASKPAPGHQIYPYLLRGVVIQRVNHLWSSDLTYIRLAGGFANLAAVIDWHSRFVLSWKVSNTPDAWLCRETLEAALATGYTPSIFNTDQGPQFTSRIFLSLLRDNHIRISMDGRGRAVDNAFIERLWRTVKYEDIYLHEYASLTELRSGLAAFSITIWSGHTKRCAIAHPPRHSTRSRKHDYVPP